jgi:peptidoglycan/LPS O-acetylase OafA/YrhL
VSDEGGYEETRRDMERVIRRLNALEYLILLGAAGLALGGGALVAFLLTAGNDWSFRLVWGVAALLLFVLPGALVLGRERMAQARRNEAERDSMNRSSDGA